MAQWCEVKYTFTAIDSKGRETQGEVDAWNPGQAVSMIRAQGLFPTLVRAKKGEEEGAGFERAGIFASAQRRMEADAKREKVRQWKSDMAAANDEIKREARQKLPKEILMTVGGFGVFLICVKAVVDVSEGGGQEGGFNSLLFLVLMAYLLPATIANWRGHQNRVAISALNILLGWSVLGWIIALVWSLTAIRK